MYRGMPSSFHDYIGSCYPDDGPWRYCCTTTLDGGITPIATDPAPPNRCDYWSHKYRDEGYGNLYFVSLHGGVDHVAVGAPGSQCDVKQLRHVPSCVRVRVCVSTRRGRGVMARRKHRRPSAHPALRACAVKTPPPPLLPHTHTHVQPSAVAHTLKARVRARACVPSLAGGSVSRVSWEG